VIVLFTDFGLAGPYTGQMKAVLARVAPDVQAIDLFADAPGPRPSAYLLAAYAAWFPEGTVFLAVVDPGVGGARAPLVVEAGGRTYVGPDNGVFELVLRRAASAQVLEIAWQPPALSASFHGRDLFAPVAAMWALGKPPTTRPHAARRFADWPDDLAEVVYLDHYGNAITGLRAAIVPPDARLRVGNRTIPRARTFSDVRPREAFWYENSNGLAEIAVNLGRAGDVLGLHVGSAVVVDK
jgi:hypothetical protein